MPEQLEDAINSGSAAAIDFVKQSNDPETLGEAVSELSDEQLMQLGMELSTDEGARIKVEEALAGNEEKLQAFNEGVIGGSYTGDAPGQDTGVPSQESYMEVFGGGNTAVGGATIETADKGQQPKASLQENSLETADAGELDVPQRAPSEAGASVGDDSDMGEDVSPAGPPDSGLSTQSPVTGAGAGQDAPNTAEGANSELSGAPPPSIIIEGTEVAMASQSENQSPIAGLLNEGKGQSDGLTPA